MSVWGELIPFLLLPDSVAREALAEYTLYLEEREGWWAPESAGTKLTWLADLINGALRGARSGAEPARSTPFWSTMNQVLKEGGAGPEGSQALRLLGLLGAANRVAWYDLLRPDVREPLDEELRKIREGIEQSPGT
jgi:hypothetical protein